MFDRNKMNVVVLALLALAITSVSATAQTNLTVPSVAPQQCSGDDCPKLTDTEDSARVPATRIPQARPQNSSETGSVAAQAQLQYLAPQIIEQHETTEFQKFVFSSTGEHLPIYGHSLFNNVPTTFAPLDRVPVPANYVIGPGDELLIHAWGQIDLDARVTVDRDGQINLPKIGTIGVAGLKYEQLHDYLRNTVGQMFKNFDLNVNLGQLRSIQIFVVGQARRPGTYTVSSLSTLVNALFASGGPALDGSMRDIELKRQNDVISQFDAYDLLLSGDKSKDTLLQPGDVIYIPPVRRLVAISGSVNMAAIYELHDGMKVQDAIAMAGGLSTTADASRAILERIEDHSTRQVDEFALDSDGMSRPLQDGDILRVFSVSPKFANAVTLRGNVAQPGRYPYATGMRVRDLIPSRDMLITRNYWLRQDALGQNRAQWTNIKLKNDGSEMNVPIDGEAGVEPDEHTEVERNASEINWDYALVQRINPVDLSSRLFSFNLGRAIEDPASTDNLVLEAGDVITIFSQSDMAVPMEKRTKFVSIEGEVKIPGVYRLNSGETLPDVVKRAGGLTSNAYLYAADFRRESTRVEQQKQLEKMFDDMDKDLRSKATLVAASATPESALQNQQEIAAQQQLLNKLRETKATGRVVLELKPGDNSVAALPRIALEDGDQLTIPPQPATVEVFGSVYNQNSFVYKSGRTVGYYLAQAGGGTRDADRARLFVVRADGSVISKQMHRGTWLDSLESLKVMPGDGIVMPEKIRTSGALRGVRDWSQVVSQVGLSAAAVSVLH